MLVSKIGLEAEFIVRNKEGKIVIPHYGVPKDGFPLLGEIRGEPARNTAKVFANFIEEKIRVEKAVKLSGHTIEYISSENVGLKVYKEVMKLLRATVEEKKVSGKQIRNIYGIDITEFSDQVLKDGKIQGMTVSCGLHINFSCTDEEERSVLEDQYESVVLPLSMGDNLDTELRLYKRKGYEKKEVIKVSASVLTRPVVTDIIKRLDKKFFIEFEEGLKTKTKYRQPGFFALKDFGFEYRSLPFNKDVFEKLPEIIDFSFELIENLNDWED